MVVFINLEFDMGLHYLAIIGKNLENKTKIDIGMNNE